MRGQTFETNKDNRKFVEELEEQKSVSELHIQNAELADSGLYVCSAVKVEDDKVVLKSIELRVTGK